MLEDKKLLNETEWTRVYAGAPKQLYYESKFVRDKLQVSAREIKQRWNVFNDEEKFDFVRAFQSKDPLTSDDEEILEFLMQVGDEDVWSTIALPLTRIRQSKRERVLSFLLARAAEGSPMRANYYQALAEMKDSTAVLILQSQYSRQKGQISLENPLASYEDLFPFVDYLTCCAALYRLTQSEEYKQAIEQMQNHPDEKVRSQAKLALPS
jgi:hypothetical protein